MKRTTDSDFIPWAYLDLDILLGEYTDENINRDNDAHTSGSESDVDHQPVKNSSTSSKSPTVKSANQYQYICPECHKRYKSIAGFRGHVTKKHQRPDIKATLHRVDDSDATDLPIKCSDSLIFNDIDKFRSVFQTTIESALQNIKQDENNLNPDSKLGGVMVRMACNLAHHMTVENSDGLNWLMEPMHSIVAHFRTGVSMHIDRENMFRKFHALRIDRTIRDSFLKFLGNCIGKTESKANMLIFIQIFLDELLNEVVKQQNASIKKTVERSDQTLSTNDHEIIYHITGYIVKRFSRVKGLSQSQKELVTAFVEVGESNKENSAHKWTRRLDRGGLSYPKQEVCDFFVAMELELREVIDLNLSSSSLRKDVLTEQIMQSNVVKRYWNNLTSSEDNLDLYEKLVKLFITVRGFAIAKHAKSSIMSSNTKCSRGNKKALRKCLKPINTF